ncbi:N-acyl-D-aspartate/D-glutamate deacylase [Sphingomonas naasensis]|uniref:D-aminoacylase n=1 Tax=Sphingomonas naasensis TaxID=1344951 RepID=A0A4S1WDX8_9SPHN|nr:amidohydrolase family protein [Sphingomonas naasensis]NIJ22216.1 N-acyl-D-aspartate/D-glutamate deacylase [Sphingomonas naasensis]TGX40763.1 D-aminoacylase [Sphingomonas naasensis]
MKVALLLGIATLSLGAASPAPQKVDLLIRGGTIYTGSAEPFVGDVAITGDRIVAVRRHADVDAARVIDASGMIVAPGFIDPHTHMGGDLASDDAQKRLVPAFLMQGVTTAFIGNDGGGSPDVAHVLGSAASRPVGINYAAYVGFGAVREKVVGEADRAPSGAELAQMKTLVASAMCEGALGLSTGLFYAPQSFAKTDEVVALAREAGKRGGVYDSHIRDESSYTVGLAAAIDEAIAIGRQGGLPAHISHIKALGVDVQGQAPAIIAKIEAARRAGQNVTADQYPWSASGTSLVASLMPLWAQDGGRPALLGRFDDPALAAKLRAGITENLRKRGGADKLLIVEGKYANRTLADVAKELGQDPVTAAISVIRIGDPGVVSFNQSEADIAKFMRQPWVMTSSDASGGHPRVYGSFARKYDKYTRIDRVITLRQFIERSSALTADTFGLAGRGHLQRGAFADVVVFDPASYAARATYEQPTLLAQGVRTVVVNGVVALDHGALTGKAAGRALAHMPTAGTCR